MPVVEARDVLILLRLSWVTDFFIWFLMARIFVYVGRIFNHGICHCPADAVFAPRQLLIKTAYSACVTGDATCLLDQITHRIAIAVEKDPMDALHVTGLLAFAPDFLP
jgi:hypothetical protein